MIHQFVFAPLMAASLCIVANGDPSIIVLEPLPHTEHGTRWLTVRDGIFEASSACVFVEVITEGQEMTVRKYKVAKAKIPEFRKWCLRQLAPLLNTSSKDDGQYAEEPKYEILFYGDENCREESTLLNVPLANVFKDFSPEKFQELVKIWCDPQK